MNLVIDIGNTFIHIAVFNDNRLLYNTIIETGDLKNLNNNFKYIRKDFNIKNIAISSVVPSINKKIISITGIIFKIKPIIVNHLSKLPVKIKVKNVITLGSDRICNAVYGFSSVKTKSNILIIDLGTANKYDLVLKNGTYIGGIIAPGINMSAKALNSNTGKLPLINVKKLSSNAPLIGKNTFEALQSGLINYMKAATESIVRKVKKQYKGSLKVILTGGSAKYILNNTEFKYIYQYNTVLYGLNYIINYKKKS